MTTRRTDRAPHSPTASPRARQEAYAAGLGMGAALSHRERAKRERAANPQPRETPFFFADVEPMGDDEPLFTA